MVKIVRKVIIYEKSLVWEVINLKDRLGEIRNRLTRGTTNMDTAVWKLFTGYSDGVIRKHIEGSTRYFKDRQ